jgi:hypothetical protein
MIVKGQKPEWPDKPPRVVAVRPLDGHRLELKFDEGTVGVVDLEGWLIGAGGVFVPLADEAFFRQVRLCSEAGTVEWPNDVDLCPDVLYSRMTGIPIPLAERKEPAPAKA